MNNLKDTLTTIAGLGVAIFVAIVEYLNLLDGGDINWVNLALGVGAAVIGFFTGRNPDGTKKQNLVKV